MSKTLVTRTAAATQGAKRYYTGKPCKRGHIAERLVSNKSCCQCSYDRIARNADYHKRKSQEWRLANPDRFREAIKQWATDNPERRRAISNQWYAANQERHALTGKAWRIANGDRLREIRKAWYAANRERQNMATKTWYAANKKRHSALVRAWANANPERIQAIYKFNNAQRRAMKKQQTPTWADRALIREIYRKCPAGYHVDHIVPLCGRNVRGLHVHYNLQYLQPADNHSKGNRHG